MELIYQIVVLVILILLSAFFSASELALFSISTLRLRHLSKTNKARFHLVEKIKQKPQKLLVTILIGNNLVNIGASALAASIAFEFIRNYAVSITTAVMTLIILIFGEIVPKSIATRHNEKISVFVARPLRVIQIVFLPVIYFFEGFTKLVSKVFKHNKNPLVTKEEIKTFVSVAEEIGQIKGVEREMIHRIFKFDDLETKDVMTPRRDIIGLSDEIKIRDAGELFYKSDHIRIPVYKKDLDHITGYVHILDLQKALNNRKGSQLIKTIKRPIAFVPATKKIDALLRFMQKKKQQIAIAVDNYGTNLGLITIEDILEEIVGEIIDETEKVEPRIKNYSNGRFSVLGKTDIFEINKKCGLKLPRKKVSKSISEYILEISGKIPKEDDVIKIRGAEIRVIEVENNVIERVIIRKKIRAKKR
ncbi:HlyC/CorC family transporter [Candidatus Woesearchaeota archaeon CG_4_10_14_0_2_um_filter_33_13]|nr:MAG: HlyC/CorC family transporter [Candidatus Woesearchaeota archaeon CG_4_10_14_0_2_um_filter_33_13]